MADPFKNRNAEKHFYVPSNTDTNKESMAQLKSNIELLFRGFSVSGQFILYPLKVLRWQSQIHSESTRYHITPFTIFPVIYNLKYQGYSSLWKGSLSMGAFYAISSTLESILAEISPLEKDIHNIHKTNKIYGHILLKFITYAITTPVYAAAMYESIQSGISTDALGISDLLRETWNRITGYRYNYRTRLIPFWSLILPTSAYFVGMHVVSSILEKVYRRVFKSLIEMFQDRRRIQCIDEIENEVIEIPYLNTIASLSANLSSIVILYPFETIINRLIVQGTRTIIDNTDNGTGVVAIKTNYNGFFDCLRTIEDKEGMLGFYKGVGIVLLECLLQFALLKLAKFAAYRIYDAIWISRNDKSNLEFLTQQDLNRPPQ